MPDLTVGQIRNLMQREAYGSTKWQALNLVLASKYCSTGDMVAAKKCADKLSVSKLPQEAKANYHLLLAAFAETKSDLEESIKCLKDAKAADRELVKPHQQFDLTKQIALIFDSNGRLDDACKEWQLLIDDLQNFEHGEHQPLLATKFLVRTLEKQEKLEEIAEAKDRWFAAQTQVVLKKHAASPRHKSTKPPDSYDDELSNFFERCRQNIFHVYGNYPELVQQLSLRNAEFWVGSESMRAWMADLKEESNSKELTDKQQLPSFFYMRCISTYFAAIQLAAAGQIPEAFGALRMCMENSLYAFHLFEKPDDADIWLDRPTLGLGEINQEKKKKRTKIGTTFSPSQLINDVQGRSQKLGDSARYFYEMTIDAGAHPNVDVFKNQASQKYEGTTYIFGLDFLKPLSSQRCCDKILEATDTVLGIFRLAHWIW